MRKVVIAGNWKMNKTPKEAVEFLRELGEVKVNDSMRVIICSTNLCLQPLLHHKKGDVEIAAQNMHFEDSGAFTGEVSTKMLKAVGVNISVIGHSERREYFAETDEALNKKVLKAAEEDFDVILCVGETLEQREKEIHKEHVKNQIVSDLKNLKEEDLKRVIIAYEPIWAIGTGKTATSEQAEEMCLFIRNVVEELYSKEAADNTSILYGGSVKPANVKELMSMENIDGALIGGASLKADSFLELIHYDK